MIVMEVRNILFPVGRESRLQGCVAARRAGGEDA